MLAALKYAIRLTPKLYELAAGLRSSLLLFSPRAKLEVNTKLAVKATGVTRNTNRRTAIRLQVNHPREDIVGNNIELNRLTTYNNPRTKVIHASVVDGVG